MPDLETRIRELADRGDITHISLTPVGKEWRAVFAPASIFGNSIATDPDPIKAIIAAMDAPRLKSRRMKPDAELLAATPATEDDDDLGLGD